MLETLEKSPYPETAESAVGVIALAPGSAAQAARVVTIAESALPVAVRRADPAFATNVERVKRRAETDGRVAKVFASLDADALEEKLAAADIAFARVNSPADLARHPHLRRIMIDTPSGPVSYPAPAEQHAAETAWNAINAESAPPQNGKGDKSDDGDDGQAPGPAGDS